MNRVRGLPNAAFEKTLSRRLAQGFLPRGWIDGLVLSNDSTDAVNDIAVAAGSCRSTVNIVAGEASTFTRDQIDIELPVGIIKQLDVAWAPENYDADGYSGGDRSGGRSVSSISNTTWHAYAIGASGLPADVLFHDSATQSSVVAALPAGYTAYRRIGSVLRSAGSILRFSQRGDEFLLWDTVNDISVGNQSTTAIQYALASVPLGIKVIALFCGSINSSGNAVCVNFTSPDQNEVATSVVSGRCSLVNEVANNSAAGQFRVRTDTLGHITVVASASGTTVEVGTFGWIDARDRDA